MGQAIDDSCDWPFWRRCARFGKGRIAPRAGVWARRGGSAMGHWSEPGGGKDVRHGCGDRVLERFDVGWAGGTVVEGGADESAVAPPRAGHIGLSTLLNGGDEGVVDRIALGCVESGVAETKTDDVEMNPGPSARDRGGRRPIDQSARRSRCRGRRSPDTRLVRRRAKRTRRRGRESIDDALVRRNEPNGLAAKAEDAKRLERALMDLGAGDDTDGATAAEPIAGGVEAELLRHSLATSGETGEVGHRGAGGESS